MQWSSQALPLKCLLLSMCRIWDGRSLPSDRIMIHARKLAWTSMLIIKENEGALAPNLGNRRGSACRNEIIKHKHWRGRHERKDTSKCKKRHAHPDAVDARTNFITSTVNAKTEFDFKVEAKTEVKVMMSKVKNSAKSKRCGIAEHAGCHYACFFFLHVQIKFI